MCFLESNDVWELSWIRIWIVVNRGIEGVEIRFQRDNAGFVLFVYFTLSFQFQMDGKYHDNVEIDREIYYALKIVNDKSGKIYLKM